jgi:hypothetical protein
MRTIVLIITLFTSLDLFAQHETKKDNFNFEVTKVTGDLNKDNLVDKVVVLQDAMNDKAPYRLQIFFQQDNGSYKLISSSTKIIEPEFPNGRKGFSNGNSFLGVTIKKGVLSINNEFLRGHSEHKFRYQNGRFELIGFSNVSSGGIGVMHTINFNLSTGIRLEKSERYDTDKVLSTKKTKVLIRPLPRLENFRPFESHLY